MKTMKTLLAGALMMMSATAFAQATYEAADGTQYEFQKHAFLNLGVGAQYTLGEAKFSDLISPNVQLGLGYQFSPVFGARIQANAWQSRGGWQADVTPGNYKYKYVAPGLDLMFNLSNLFCGWNPNRVFNLTAFLGGGANIAFSNDEVNAIAKRVASESISKYNLEYVWDGTKVRPYGRAGLEAAFKLSDAVALTLEGNANILSDKYNSKKHSGNKLKADWYFNALIGLKINLGKAYNKIVPPPAPAPEPEPEPQPIVEAAPVPAPAAAVVVEEKIEPIRRDIFFPINVTAIQATETQKVKDIADYLTKYPKAKVVVTGYADAGTGNDKINDRLAAGRADTVVKALINEYGIAQDRISYDSKGSRVQPFAENDMNRVSICIAE